MKALNCFWKWLKHLVSLNETDKEYDDRAR